MAIRQVIAAKKDEEGEIISICNKNEYWFSRSKSEAIRDIESGSHTYYVMADDKMVKVIVFNDPKKGKYLRTKPGKTAVDRLSMLPDC